MGEKPRRVAGKWLIEEKKGTGAFGAVYLATNLETDDEAAVKFAKTEDARRSLRREAAMLEAVKGCPGVPVLMSARLEGEPCYLMMKRYGASLDRPLGGPKGPRLSAEQVGRIGAQILTTLEAIHGRGVVHCDVKPGNMVFSSNFDRRITPVLIDFGLARVFRDGEGRARPSTGKGLRGTVRYASVWAHAGETPAPRDDCWSLWYSLLELEGVVLPWKGKSEDREAVRAAKVEFQTACPGLREEQVAFAQHLETVGAEELPDYGRLRELATGGVR